MVTHCVFRKATREHSRAGVIALGARGALGALTSHSLTKNLNRGRGGAVVTEQIHASFTLAWSTSSLRCRRDRILLRWLGPRAEQT